MSDEEKHNYILSNRRPINNSLLFRKKKLIQEKIRIIDKNIDISDWVNKDIYLYVIDMTPMSKGRLFFYSANGEDEVYIDYNFLKDNSNYEVIIHQLTHELLHSLCQFMNQKKIYQTFNHNWFDDDRIYRGIDEATTQMFTDEFETKKLNEEQDSNFYFIKNIMRILKVIIGEKELLLQYLNRSDSFEQSFNNISNNKFIEFSKLINKIYCLNYEIFNKLKLRLDYSTDTIELNDLKKEVIYIVNDIIKDSLILIPDLHNQLETEFSDNNFYEEYFDVYNLNKSK